MPGVPEARILETEHGSAPEGDGWFVLNAREAVWDAVPGLGGSALLEGDVRFGQFGVNIHVLPPGEPNAMYHAEEDQEDFLVLSGECLLLVEGHERRLRAWDFVHCPPWTEHAFVGAGEEPCAILMIGGRAHRGLRYPVSEIALRHGAGVEEETDTGRVAYERFPEPVKRPFREGDLPER